MILKKTNSTRGQEFLELCQKHTVETFYAFSSSITDRFNELASDIDLLVEIDESDPNSTEFASSSLDDQTESKSSYNYVTEIGYVDVLPDDLKKIELRLANQSNPHKHLDVEDLVFDLQLILSVTPR